MPTKLSNSIKKKHQHEINSNGWLNDWTRHATRRKKKSVVAHNTNFSAHNYPFLRQQIQYHADVNQ